MNRQAGFTLVELMVVIAIIATLGAIALPGYQRYIIHAALIDMLQLSAPYRSAVELCALQQGSLDQCRSGRHGIPAVMTSRYVSASSVQQGVISLSGQLSLQGLTVVMTPVMQAQGLRWARQCRTEDQQEHLSGPCRSVFHSDETGDQQ
ncbi:prepilin peptidase-dependent pilin [Biostraticola tofi]|uniref:Prepilin peptidase dependent protein D n=1 Tax=Biostraticola tofi TaxID=466109 RepID=A0A4R3Z594_9GAMM|nr:prepilin peptidase-dependent pilin [Biostraticola tofi]TCV99169.1 prepilin peptidase dependent protein D [Biostraticola tofi]